MPPRHERNPPNRYTGESIVFESEPRLARLELYEDATRSILAENDSPDLSFRYSLNPYRGCQHACAYCYARPSHSYLDFGAGTDFDRKIVVKRRAPELLRETFTRKSWKGDTIVFSGNTDCYQPIEGALRLTRSCLEVCAEFQNPVALITKSTLVKRDLDVLLRLKERASVAVFFSIAFADDDVARALEPGAPLPSRRFETMRALADTGIPVGISLAPMIPGLNDADAPTLLERAHDAGARRAFITLVRLSLEVLPVFQERLKEAFPQRAARVEHAIAEMKGGKMNETKFHTRMQGTGPRWQMIEDVFRATCARLGFNEEDVAEGAPKTTTFQRPTKQLSLF